MRKSVGKQWPLEGGMDPALNSPWYPVRRTESVTRLRTLLAGPARGAERQRERRRQILGAVLAALLLVTGCDELFYSGLDPASTPDRPVFDFGRRRDLSGAAKLYRFSLEGRPRDTACWTTFWGMRVVDGKRYSEVDRLGYGDVPADFRVTHDAESLPAGYVYLGNGGFHGIGQDCYFEITRDSSGGRSIHTLTEEEFRTITGSTGGSGGG